MADRPILFQPAMIKALLDGRKTQTRRLLKPQPKPFGAGGWYRPQRASRPHEWHFASSKQALILAITTVRFAEGDRLWVRESWGINHSDYIHPPHPIPKARPDDLRDDKLVYFATEADAEIVNEMARTPGIHMPRWASRVTLTVTNVRVQRLQDISQEDAIAEGVERPATGIPITTPRIWYGVLWDRINGAGNWDKDPFVVALTFTVEQKNIDA